MMQRKHSTRDQYSHPASQHAAPHYNLYVNLYNQPVWDLLDKSYMRIWYQGIGSTVGQSPKLPIKTAFVYFLPN